MLLQQPFAIHNGVFTPLSIAGCKFWVKADSLSLSDGDPVGTWADQSGNSADVTQATAGKKPLYKTGIINSLPAVLFDGSDDYLSGTVFTSVQPLTIFVVTQPTLNTASQKTYACITTRITGFFIVAKLSTSFWGTFTGPTGDLSTTNTLTSGSNYLITNTVDAISTFLYQRGVQVATRAETESGAGNLNLGNDVFNGSREYAGYIAEQIIYNSVLSSGNRALVENYLIAKYAL